MRHKPGEPLRLIPIRDHDGRWFVTAFAKNGDAVHTSNPKQTRDEAFDACRMWLSYCGWRPAEILIFKEDRDHESENSNR